MIDSPRPSPAPTRAQLQDLGFGTVVARESRRRLLNRDGSFNVRRSGLGLLSVSPYQTLLTTTWTRFLSVTTLFYLAVNTVFALLYKACGPGALRGVTIGAPDGSFFQAFNFSVETFATIGYGHIAPIGVGANALVTTESLVSMLSVALLTGLIFARFSRPTAHIVFSEKALIAPYQAITAFEFRIANARNNQLIELEAKVLYSRFPSRAPGATRAFTELTLERHGVAFFPLSWTIVHPIDEASPLYGLSDDDLRETDAEFLILLTGIDETFSQTVHARSSYKAEEVVWNARFANVFNRPGPDGTLSIDLRQLHRYDDVAPAPAPTPAPTPAPAS